MKILMLDKCLIYLNIGFSLNLKFLLNMVYSAMELAGGLVGHEPPPWANQLVQAPIEEKTYKVLQRLHFYLCGMKE